MVDACGDCALFGSVPRLDGSAALCWLSRLFAGILHGWFMAKWAEPCAVPSCSAVGLRLDLLPAAFLFAANSMAFDESGSYCFVRLCSGGFVPPPLPSSSRPRYASNAAHSEVPTVPPRWSLLLVIPLDYVDRVAWNEQMRGVPFLWDEAVVSGRSCSGSSSFPFSKEKLVLEDPHLLPTNISPLFVVIGFINAPMSSQFARQFHAGAGCVPALPVYGFAFSASR